jgi:hypothetical protein
VRACVGAIVPPDGGEGVVFVLKCCFWRCAVLTVRFIRTGRHYPAVAGV